MSDRLKFERFVWFHSQTKRSRYPNSRWLVDEFEVSQRTGLRDIEFMRDRLSAPLEFDRAKKRLSLYRRCLRIAGASEVYGPNHLIRDSLVSAAGSWPLGCVI